MLQKRDGRTCVYRRRYERFAQNCVLKVVNLGGGSVMMWDAISYARKTQLVHFSGNLHPARYRDKVLTPHMLPTMNLCREVFQHDNARLHTARATVDFLAKQNIRVLPGCLNHQIWTQWNIYGMIWIDACVVVNQRRKLCSRLLSKNGGEIRKTVFVNWSESMPRRVCAVLQANGGHNIY
jgi:hypothetical protein